MEEVPFLLWIMTVFPDILYTSMIDLSGVFMPVRMV